MHSASFTSARDTGSGDHAITRSIRLLWILSLLVVASSASAVPIRFGLTGTVDEIIRRSTGDENDPVPDSSFLDAAGVQAGATFTASYWFDPTAPDTNPDPRYGYYWSLLSGEFEIGSYSTEFYPSIFSTLLVSDSEYGNLYAFLGANLANPLPGTLGGNINLEMREFSGAGFTSDALPLTPIDVALFPAIRSPHVLVSLALPSGPSSRHGVNVHVVLDDFFLINPEPSSAGLLGLGLVLLAARRRHGPH